MNKYLTIEVLKKLFYPALLVSSGCIFKLTSIGTVPVLKEQIEMTRDIQYKNTPYTGLGYDYFDLPVYKSVQIQNPTDKAQDINFSCGDFTWTMKVPPHSYKKALYVSNNKYMYSDLCEINWTKETN